MLETYNFSEKNKKFDCDITIFYGEQDNLTIEEDLNLWKLCTRKECKLYAFKGGHFFINDRKEQIINIINDTLNQY